MGPPSTDSAATGGRQSPITPFIYCATITLALLVAGGLVFASRYRAMVEIQTVATRFAGVEGESLRLDEVLTMSARMAAATGDPRWERRYRDSEPLLDQAIKAALTIAPDSTGGAAATDAANVALIAMENHAFQLTREGKLPAATAVFDGAYETQKEIYTRGMAETMAAITRAVDDRLAAHRRSIATSVAVAAFALALLVWLWLRMLSRIKRYIRDRADAEAGLRDAHATLEDRVERRTREVAASHAQYRFLVENIDAIPFEWDPWKRKMNYIAPQAAKLFACRPEQLHEDGFFAPLLHEDDRGRVLDHIERFVKGAMDCTVDARMITIGKRVLHVRLLLSTRTPTGAACGVLLDITKQARLESELQRAQKLESVGRLAAGVAHEINTPVQFVSDSVQFIRDSLTDVMRVVDKHRMSTRRVLVGEPCSELATDAMSTEADVDMVYLSEHVPKALDRALDGLSRVTTIVRSMNVFAHPDRMDKAQIDLNEALTSTLTIAHTEYRFVADVETELGELPRVSCYAGELNQVFLNLLTNAAHAIADVVRDTGERGRITVSTRRDDDHVVIAIKDTGSGIPAAIRDQVFDPFFTTKEVGSGTGQGLSHARAVVVERHGGTLTFDSGGQGTTFYIRIPIDGAHSAAA